MARRAKSVNDIIEQGRRLRSQTDDPARYRRIRSIGRRYLDNIYRTRSYRNSIQRELRINRQAQDAYLSLNSRRGAELSRQGTAVGNQRYNRQYSQRTYMGLNEG